MSKIAIDVGSGMTKAMCGHRQTWFKSAVGRYNSEGFVLDNNPKDIINTRNGCWIAGEGADCHIKSDDLEDTLCKNWHRNEGYKILFYKAVAELFADGLSGELKVCTGAPVRYFQQAKEDIQKILIGRHKFKCDSIEYDFVIEPDGLLLAPQVVGLYFAELDLEEDVPNETRGYFDFGTYTSGFAMFKGGQYVKWGEGGEEIGGGVLGRFVQNEIENDFGIRVEIAAVMDAIDKGMININGTKEDIGRIINKAARDIMTPLNKTILAKWEGAAIDKVIVGGGYGKLFYSAVRKAFPHAEIAGGEASGMMGVVNGYQKYLTVKSL